MLCRPTSRRSISYDDIQAVVGRERRERLSQLALCGGGCFDSRRRVNSDVMPLTSPAIDLSDRARGCILAGTIGDAMGGPFEGKPGPLKFHDPSNWSISDDSQLTLATCESI